MAQLSWLTESEGDFCRLRAKACSWFWGYTLRKGLAFLGQKPPGDVWRTCIANIWKLTERVTTRTTTARVEKSWTRKGRCTNTTCTSTFFRQSWFSGNFLKRTHVLDSVWAMVLTNQFSSGLYKDCTTVLLIFLNVIVIYRNLHYDPTRTTSRWSFQWLFFIHRYNWSIVFTLLGEISNLINLAKMGFGWFWLHSLLWHQ